MVADSINLSNSWQTLEGSISAVSKPILQVNIRWKALDDIYKIYMLLRRSDLNISKKIHQTFSQFSANFAKFVMVEFLSVIFA